MTRPIFAAIDTQALRDNYLLAKEKSGRAKAWAIIKSNAYGHGQEMAYKALMDIADGFALLEIESAVMLREWGWTKPILLLEGFFSSKELITAQKYQLQVVLHNKMQIELLKSAAQSAYKPLRLHIKFNTGMNRLGFKTSSLKWLWQQLAEISYDSISLMTHFADADGASGIQDQVSCFTRMLDISREEGWQGGEVSLANSAALLKYPESHADWVRPGIMLYGGSPYGWNQPGYSAAELGLKAVMHLNSQIIAVQKLEAGEYVGYGGTFEAQKTMRIGIVACGYADGYPRHAPTGTPIVVNGMRTRTLGRVSMDMLAVDLSDIPAADVGSKVLLWGTPSLLCADEVADSAGTISYELFCALAQRVPIQIT